LIIPYYNPARRNVTFSLFLVLALLLLVLTGLGVFRMYFSFDWMGGQEGSGQLFALKVRGGNSYNLFEAAPFGSVFWSTQVITVLLAIALPWFRLIGGSILALLAAGGIFMLHFQQNPAAPTIPMEFELLIVLVLYVLYVLLQYFAEIRDRKHFAGLLSQYVPPELANAYTRNPDSMGLQGEEREITVLFCDVVGFAAISEQLESKQVAQLLNGFFSHVSKVVVRHRGTIDKFMGDSVMAIWGAPAPTQTHAFDALSAAMDIQNELARLNTTFKGKSLPEISVGIGVSTGMATVGPLGSDIRMDYTVVGDTVNVAQRLEEQTRKYHVPIIVSDKTAAALPDILFRELDTVIVKGRKRPVTMLQPMGASVHADIETKKFLTLHRQAMEASKAGDWSKATDMFTRLRNEWGPEDMYDLYLNGIKQASSSSKCCCGRKSVLYCIFWQPSTQYPKYKYGNDITRHSAICCNIQNRPRPRSLKSGSKNVYTADNPSVVASVTATASNLSSYRASTNRVSPHGFSKNLSKSSGSGSSIPPPGCRAFR